MADVRVAKEYLEDGGLGEVMGLASIAVHENQPKVQMDADMAVALCMLASEALHRRKAR
jgi:hypothetical protein